VATSTSPAHEIRQLLIETASLELGNCIAAAVDRVLRLREQLQKKDGNLTSNRRSRALIAIPSTNSLHQASSVGSPTTDAGKGSRRASQQNPQQFTTEFDFFLFNFLRREIGQVTFYIFGIPIFFIHFSQTAK
jgi:hypothetical protein